ncbi:unnamed protein product [Rotaria magnacalcarata]|uniref:Transmembrane protein n=1 Tax=Rotaria magnacalcarata TaxID=392030 RepID=A0A816VAU1_9BILA|nr:unnamed protein product [Rotaria magnacalcarata]
MTIIFYSSLFYLIYFSNKTIGLSYTDYDGKIECSVRIETDNGFETCFNNECSNYKDPWRIVETYSDNQRCYLHYLKLSFSNYDQLIVFIELQTTNNNSLENFFAPDHDSKRCFLEIEIDQIYPFNSHYFLRQDMLNKLGGIQGRIHILQLKIQHWYRSIRSVIQFVENDMIQRQPFQQIIISYPCNILQTRTQLILIKHLKYQEQSTCPTQIKIMSDKDKFNSNYEKIKLQENESIEIHKTENISVNKPNIICDSFNQSYSDYNTKKNFSETNIFAKIAIVFIIIVLIIVFSIYHFFYAPPLSSKT